MKFILIYVEFSFLQKLTVECDKLKNNQINQTLRINHDLNSVDNSANIDNLYERLKNSSFDATQQRKLNKNLQTENEMLNKNVQSLNEK